MAVFRRQNRSRSGFPVRIVFLAAAVQTAVWLMIVAVDPFGTETATDRSSESIFLKFWSLAYPTSARDDIVVVMIDESQLPIMKTQPSANGESLNGSQWPIPFGHHKALLTRILAFEPEAVFVDLLFDTHKGRDPAQLKDIIKRSADDTPVLFATYQDHGKLVKPLRENPDRLAVVEWTAPNNHYPFRVSNSEVGLTPAAKLYRHYRQKRGGPALEPAGDNILLTWGIRLPPEATLFSDTCAPYEDGGNLLEDTIRLASAGTWDRLWQKEARSGPGSWERPQPCAYHSEIRAKDVFDPDAEMRLARQIAGKYVFVGARIGGIEDIVNSPVHGQLPGVYFHAMALDNLIAMNGRPIKAQTGRYTLIQLGLIFVVAAATGALFSRRPAIGMSRLQAARSLTARVVLFLLVLILSGVLIFILAEIMRLAPYNWTGAVGISAILIFAGSAHLLQRLLRFQRQGSGRLEDET